jgi:serine O-acetyltransferase
MNGAKASQRQNGSPAIPPPLRVVASDSGVDAALLWTQMRQAAQQTAQREPLLQARLRELVLDQPSLTAALAAVLARRLACADLQEQALRALMMEVLTQNPDAVMRFVADLLAVQERDPACAGPLHVLLNLKGFQALQAYRIAHALWHAGRGELALTLANQASLVFAADIHPAARIGAGVMIDHATGVVIGETAVVEDNVSILQNVTLGGTGKEHGDRHPKVRTGVMIGAGATILGNIEIGAMSKVAAGSVVLHPVPPHCTVAGVPARVVRHQQPDSCPSQEMDQTL